MMNRVFSKELLSANYAFFFLIGDIIFQSMWFEIVSLSPEYA